LIGENGQVTGLIDWTEAEVFDPSIDFQIYYALFGEHGLSELIGRYEIKDCCKFGRSKNKTNLES
jgi:macrolide phosphotransferase